MIRLKTKEEIAVLREGGKRHAAILAHLTSMVRPGLTTLELEEEARRLIAEGGDTSAFLGFKSHDSSREFPAALCVSVNDAIVHGIPNENVYTLKEGDIVSLDLGLVHKGMFTDAAVTVPVGKVSPEVTKIIEVTKQALVQGIKAAKGGKTVGDIGAAIERVALAHGYALVEELAGHGVGYDVHEDPYVPNYGEAGKGEKLVPGMVIAIEPIFTLGSRHIYLDKDGWTYRTKDGSYATHEEHTVLITKGGAEILTA